VTAGPLARVTGALVLVFILAPTAIVVLTSLNGSAIIEFPPTSLSLRWYGTALGRPEFQSAALTSLLVALLATAIGTPIALAAAFALVRGDFAGREVVQAFLLSPLVVPGIVVSLGILLVSAQIGFRAGVTRLVIAHVLITLPFLLRTLVAGMVRTNILTEEAARTLGATPWRTFVLITLPALYPSLIAGMLFALIVSFDNVSISLFLATARTNTLPLAVLSHVEYNYDPSIAALSTMLVLVSMAAALLLERAVGLRRALGA
jgi:putative spermidine/putrescine transport system permease protein